MALATCNPQSDSRQIPDEKSGSGQDYEFAS